MLGLLASACTASTESEDAGADDAGPSDAGVADAGAEDAGPSDSGVPEGLVLLDGGGIILAGTVPCSQDLFYCDFATWARFFSVPGLQEWDRSFRGVVEDAGPGSSNVLADGGPVLVQWPAVDGHVFAAPAIGEEIEVRITWGFGGEGSPEEAIEVFTVDGRLLVSEGNAALSSSVFRLTDLQNGQACSNPESPSTPQCCCATETPVWMEVATDPPTLLPQCGEALVQVDGQPMFIRIDHAAELSLLPCGAGGRPPLAYGLAVAVVE
ncbi:MAG: hypothetical protein HYS27_16305 [Deltaproteobacteria bacterium]|nr:hypothetical protein [Deltaproteobacteria bacterium]